MTFSTPAPFVIYVTVAPTRKNGLTTPHTARIGAATNLEGVKNMIADDRASARRTFGGLIEPSTSERTYRIFRAAWTEVALEEV